MMITFDSIKNKTEFLGLILILALLACLFLFSSGRAFGQSFYGDVDELVDEINSESDLENYVDYDNYEEIVDEWERRQKEQEDDRKELEKDKKKKKLGDLTFRSYKTFNDGKDPYYYLKMATNWEDRVRTNFNYYRPTGKTDWTLSKAYVDYITYYGDEREESVGKDALEEFFETDAKVEEALKDKLGRKTSGVKVDKDFDVKDDMIVKPGKESPKKDTSLFLRAGRWRVNEMSEKYMARRGGKGISITGYKLSPGTVDGIVLGKHWKHLMWYASVSRPVDKDASFFWNTFDFIVDNDNYAGYAFRIYKDKSLNSDLNWYSVYSQRKIDKTRFFTEYTRYMNAGDLWYNNMSTQIKRFDFLAKYYRKRRTASDIEGLPVTNFDSWDKISASASAAYKLSKTTRIKLKFDQYDTKTTEPGSEYQYTTSELSYQPTMRTKLKFYYKWGRSTTKDGTQFKGQVDYVFSRKTSVSSYIKLANSDLSLPDKKTTYFQVQVRRKLRWGDRMSFYYYNTGKTGEEAVHKIKGEYVLAF